ncbi:MULTISPECIES: endonuclease MutS2 [unclassified Lebetimonas]|uniref:endonuclease MutS2 n=1 Tax=unclassified Lebetimonas TaxID=2648158 RepID=UPI0004650AB9|nr:MULTISPECIES: endonuclease MutS2 [unclassified Lebetimonas]
MVKKLDLSDYINRLYSLFAREKDFKLNGDINVFYKYLKKLENKDFKSPPEVKNLDKELIHLKKYGDLSHSQIFEFVKIINYFDYLKSRNWEDLAEWFDKIEIPSEIKKLTLHYNKKGEIIGFIELDEINEKIKEVKTLIRQELYKYINSKKLEPFLVDKQIHMQGDEETLLLRGGFNKIIDAEILGRSQSGFFYIFPRSIGKLKKRIDDLLSLKEEFLEKKSRKFSNIFRKWVKFLNFINSEFDKFDHLQARIFLAKNENLEFILPKKSKNFCLRDFCHPALSGCKPVNVQWDKQVLIITGVNAGGKTMLLKSILSSAFMAKHLLPMKTRETSIIPAFKEIKSIIQDPQNVKNDISTFAGRIKEFKEVFGKEDYLIGVDEIELGTDANEAATLFKVIIEEIMKKNRIVITTHHKRLASLLAKHEDVELLAAVYDEKQQKPTYEFIKGTIGRSFAFETAKRYGIPLNIINKAKQEYSEDLEKLDILIEKAANAQYEYNKKLNELNQELKNTKELKESLLLQKKEFNESLTKEKNKLLKEFNNAIKAAKEAIKAKSTGDAHRKLNEANQIYKKIKIKKEEINKEFKVGDKVKFKSSVGEILEIKGKNALVNIESKKLLIPKNQLEYYKAPIKKEKIKISKPKAAKADIKLDLHGLRMEEAIEKTEEFLNNAALAELEEVWIYHGMGKGILAKGITELLKNHPLVKSFTDAPPHMGGYGAKIIKL